MIKSKQGVWTLLILLFMGGTIELSAQAETADRATAPAMAMTDTADISSFFPFGENEEVKWKYQFGTSPAGFIDFFPGRTEELLREQVVRQGPDVFNWCYRHDPLSSERGWSLSH